VDAINGQQEHHDDLLEGIENYDIEYSNEE
jgi:hypothetical protein